MELGCTYFGFQGGEFFLDSGYRDIIAAVRPSANRIAITTNGYLLNQGIIQELKKLGVDLINFSLDSSIPEEHDAFRGIKGSYARVMEAIKMSRRLGMNVTINATVCHDNLYTKGLRDLMEFSHAHKILLNTLFAAPVGHWEANLNALLNKDDVAYYNALRVKYPFMVRDMDSGFKGSGCPALKEVLYITPYGDVLGCPFIHISLGNLKKEPLGAIRRRALSMENLDFYQRYNPVCLIAEDEDFIKST
jgi:MoaA/NifB/PqqE/SkfB family radical SAM enzyme